MFKRIYGLQYVPQEDKIFGYCDCCKEDIFEGETIYEIDGETIHEDCLLEYARKYFEDCKEEAECSGSQRMWG